MSNEQAPHTASDLGAYLLRKNHDQSGETLNLMKLNALLYYAEAWSLAVFGHELTSEEIQAWDHGPMFPSLWELLKHRGWNPLESGDLPQATGLGDETVSLLDDVWQAYADFSLPELEKMIKQDAPWKDARRGLPAWDLSKKPMSKAAMAKFYKATLEAGQSTSAPATPSGHAAQLSQQY
jgi:uncharacterized phage-associated protein